MKKRLTFSRTFPAYHPRKGENTYFVERILTQLGIDYTQDDYFEWLRENNIDIDSTFLMHFWESTTPFVAPKSTTIRTHKIPLNVGDYINPLCWAGKPYNKTKEGYWQIKFAPDIDIKKVWNFDKDLISDDWYLNGSPMSSTQRIDLAINDGLAYKDMLAWFNKPFIGRVYCWNDKVNF